MAALAGVPDRLARGAGPQQPGVPGGGAPVRPGNRIPWVVFCKGDRKLDVVRPYLDAAEKADQSNVVAIGEAREFQWVFDATKKDGPDGLPWFKFYRTERLVTCYYF